MSNSTPALGGIIHTYQKYDPLNFPSPNAEQADLVSPAFEHLLSHGNMRRFSEEELAKMVKIDPRQIQGMIANLEFLKQKLRDRKAQILRTYETDRVQKLASNAFRSQSNTLTPPPALAQDYHEAVRNEQLLDLENLYYRAPREDQVFKRGLVQLVNTLGEKYQVDELAAKYEFTGRQAMTVPEALEIKEELETIDKLLQQLDEVQENGQLGYIDLDELSELIDEEGLDHLRDIQRQMEEYVRQQAEQQGLERGDRDQYQMTPKAYRLFQSKVLSTIFNELQASRTGRHPDAVLGEGAVESPRTKGV